MLHHAWLYSSRNFVLKKIPPSTFCCAEKAACFEVDGVNACMFIISCQRLLSYSNERGILSVFLQTESEWMLSWLYLSVCVLNEEKTDWKKMGFEELGSQFFHQLSCRWCVLATQHINPSAYIVHPCGYSYFLITSVSVCSSLCVRGQHWWNCLPSITSSSSSSSF